MELIAIKSLSKAFNNPAIWRNALYAVITAVVGTVVLVASIFALLFGIPLMPIPMKDDLYPLLVIGAIFVVDYVFLILSGRYYKNLYNELANSNGISEFRDAARLTWLGALLSIIIVGAFLMLVGRIFDLTCSCIHIVQRDVNKFRAINGLGLNIRLLGELIGRPRELLDTLRALCSLWTHCGCVLSALPVASFRPGASAFLRHGFDDASVASLLKAGGVGG